MIARIFSVGFVLAFSHALSAQQGQPLPATSQQPPTKPDKVTSSAAATSLPPIRLAARPDSAKREAVEGQVLELKQKAEAATDGTTKAALLAAAANLHLAYDFDEACTLRFLHVKTSIDGVSTDQENMRSLLGKVDALLEQASQAIRKVSKSDGQVPSGTVEVGRNIESVKAFSDALRAYLLTADERDSARATRAAASGLSMLIEDERPEVAAAAVFWQAILRGAEDDPAPALSILSLALADPPKGAASHAFFARLLRCRLLAKQGGYGTALALLVQIEERCHVWFTEDAPRNDALRAAAIMRIEVLQDWLRHIDPAGDADARQWITDRIQRIKKTTFGAERDSVLRLTPAIPIIALPPSADARRTGQSAP